MTERPHSQSNESQITRNLTNELEKHVKASKLTLCLAPSGYGKSALLDSLERELQKEDQLFWRFNLTEADNQHGLLPHLIRVISEKTTPYSAPYVEELTNLLPASPCYLLVDNYEKIDSLDNNLLIETLLQETPDTVHLVVASRRVPRFSYSKLQLADAATIIDANQLRFSKSETNQLLNILAAEKGCTEEIATVIHQRTEGWPVAVRLCGNLLNESQGSGFLQSFSGKDSSLRGYFREQVLSELPEELCSFSARLSNFSSFSIELANAIQDDDAELRIRELLEHQVFIQAIDRNQTSFRFHPLFSDFLKTTSWQPVAKDRKSLLLRASNYAYDHHNAVAAIDYAIDANDFKRVEQLLNLSAQSFVRDQGLLPKLIQWCDRIPLDDSSSSIQLHFWLAWAFTFSCLPEQAYERIRKIKSMVGKTRTLKKHQRHELHSRITSVNLAQAIFRDDSQWTYVQSQKWLRIYRSAADPFDISVVESALFLSSRLLLKYSDAKRAISAAKHHITSANSLYGSMWIHALDGLYEMEFGDCHVAQKILKNAYDNLKQQETQVSPIRSTIALLLAKSYYDSADLCNARELLEDGFVHIDKHGLTETAAAGITLECKLAMNDGHEQALYTLSKAEFLTSHYSSRLKFVLHKLRTELLLAQGDIEKAEEEAVIAGCTTTNNEALTAESETPLIHVEKLRLAILLQFYLGKYTSALKQITELLNRPSTLNRPLFYIDLLIIYSALLFKTDDKQLAFRQLSKALKKATTTGLIQVFIDQKRLVEPVLRDLILRRQRASLLAEDELIKRLEKMFEINFDSNNNCLTENPIFTEREKEILTLIPSSLTVQEVADYVFLSKATIKTHLYNIYRKLGVKNRSGAIEAINQQKLL